MSEVEVRGLVKRAGKKLVVDDVSFRVMDGEFFVLLGPSGCGKTTILRLISGLERPDQGRVLINGQDVTDLPPGQRNIGMVFQEAGLYPTMDVYGNIAYGLELRKFRKEEIDTRVRTAADVLELTPLLKRSIVDLSGGEQQRVALARALVKNAETYLFDEPLSNLDPRLRYQARREMMIVHRIRKKPSVYVTHDQLEAFAIANRIGMISAEGKLLQVGTPDEIYYKPANLFIAQFVGTPPMNIIPVHILHAEQRYSVQGDGIYFTLAPHWKSILQKYGQPWAMLGIRPSTIIPEWAFSALDHSAYFLTYAQVLEIDPRVSDTVVKLKIGANTKVNAVFDDVKESQQLEEGRIINIGIHREQIYLFNPQSGELLNEAVYSQPT